VLHASLLSALAFVVACGSREASPEERVLEERVPEEGVLEERVPKERVPEERVPEESVPEEGAPEEHVSDPVVRAGADTLYAIGDPPAVLTLPGAGAERLRETLDALAIDGLDRTARIVLQHDLWGLWARLGDASSPLGRSVECAIRRLAVEAPDALPVPAPLAGFRELATELPSLQHERLHGMRRVFVLARRAHVRALYSRLLAVDPRGEVYVSEVVGEIEWLRFSPCPTQAGPETGGSETDCVDAIVEGPLVEARVWKLEREGFSLHELDAVREIPALGADAFLFQVPEPVLLEDLPCATCHEREDVGMALATDELPLDWRRDDVLSRAVAPRFGTSCAR